MEEPTTQAAHTVEAAYYALAFVSAMAAGGINSVAGGGTLISFPAAMAILGEGSGKSLPTHVLGIWLCFRFPPSPRSAPSPTGPSANGGS